MGDKDPKGVTGIKIKNIKTKKKTEKKTQKFRDCKFRLKKSEIKINRTKMRLQIQIAKKIVTKNKRKKHFGFDFLSITHI